MPGKDLAKDLTLAAWPTPEKAMADGGHHSRSGDRGEELLIGGLVRSISSPPACPVNLPAGQGSSLERRTTAGSGAKLYESCGKSGPLGRCLRILLESETYSSTEFGLKWMAKAVPSERSERWSIVQDAESSARFWKRLKRVDTPSSRSVYRLVPSMRRTDGSGGGLSADAPTPDMESAMPTPASRDVKDQTQNPERMDYVPNILKASWPTPQERDDGGRQPSPEGALARIGPRSNLDDGLAIATGPTTSGCLAQTERFVVRLMTLSAWLMGYTGVYLRLWETASSGRSRRKS
jgi:hypothetical protein